MILKIYLLSPAHRLFYRNILNIKKARKTDEQLFNKMPTFNDWLIYHIDNVHHEIFMISPKLNAGDFISPARFCLLKIFYKKSEGQNNVLGVGAQRGKPKTNDDQTRK